MRRFLSLMCTVVVTAVIVGLGGAPAQAATFTKPVIRFTLGADMNKDGRGEIIVIDNSGRLLMFAGRADGTLGTSYQLGGSGWSSYRVFGPGDLNGDGKSDILAIDPSGDLYLYPGNGTSALGARVKVGYGWSAWRLAASGDFTSDGKPDLLGIDKSGDLYLYPGKGDGTFKTKVKVGSGWIGWDLYAAGDLNADGKADILAVSNPGNLYQCTGKGDGTFNTRVKVGSGWLDYRLAAGADLNGDGKANIIGVSEVNGKLFYYKGTGTGFETRIQIDTAWLVKPVPPVAPVPSIPTGSAQDLAQKILKNSNIQYIPVGGSNPRADMEHIAKYGRAPNCGGYVSSPTDPKLLGLLLAASDRFVFKIGTITSGYEIGGDCSSGSHVSGVGLDLNYVYEIATGKTTGPSGGDFKNGGSTSAANHLAHYIDDLAAQNSINIRFEQYGPTNVCGNGTSGFSKFAKTYESGACHHFHLNTQTAGGLFWGSSWPL